MAHIYWRVMLRLHQFGFWNRSVYNKLVKKSTTYTHTHTRLMALCPGLPGWASTKKEEPIWILLKQETVSGDGISWAICKSAPYSRQIPHQLLTAQFFTGRMPFLPPNQQRQTTASNMYATNRMPKRTPWQAVQQIPIKSATIRQSETESMTSPLGAYCATNRTNGDWAIQKQRPLRRQNIRKWQKLVPMATSLRYSDPISQESSTTVGLPAGEKTAKVGRVLFEQIGPAVVLTGSNFGSQGHPRSGHCG